MNEEALMRAVLTNPEDMGPRFVYADWLTERGDPRGEFIALECLTEHKNSDESRRVWQRIRELEETHGATWLDALGLKEEEGTFHRGFIEDLRITAERLLEVAPRLAGRVVVRRLRLRKSLSLAALGDCLGSFPHLAEISFNSEELGDQEARAIAAWPCLDRLTELDLDGSRMGVEGIEAIIRAPLSTLTTLSLRCCELSEDHVRALASSPSLTSLTSLELGSNKFGDKGLRALAAPPHLAGLVDLGLDSTEMGDDGLCALARSHMVRLEKLDVGYNRVGPEGIRAMLTSSRFAGLTSLELNHNDLGSDGVRLLAEFPRLAVFTKLNLQENNIGAEGAVALARSSHLGRLTSLSLRGNRIGDEGAAALAAAPHLSALTWLDLGKNRIGDRGACAFAASTSLASLDDLDLSENNVGDEGARALAQAHLPALGRLDVSGNQISEAGLTALVESTQLTLCGLHINDNACGKRGVRALEERFEARVQQAEGAASK